MLFEALNRVITVVFKFVPFRVGVDEASSGALAPLLGMNPVVGVSLAVVRKVRNLFWAGIGMARYRRPSRPSSTSDGSPRKRVRASDLSASARDRSPSIVQSFAAIA